MSLDNFVLKVFLCFVIGTAAYIAGGSSQDEDWLLTLLAFIIAIATVGIILA